MGQNKGNCVFSHVMQQVLLTPIEGVELHCDFFYLIPGTILGYKGAQITWVNTIQISYITNCNLGSLSILWRSIRWNFDQEFSKGGC